MICLGAVLLGLFVAAEPEIFHLPMKNNHDKSGVNSGNDSILKNASTHHDSSTVLSMVSGSANVLHAKGDKRVIFLHQIMKVSHFKI